MKPTDRENDAAFQDALRGLERGDFSRLAPLFEAGSGAATHRPRILLWVEGGRFAGATKALAEALTCACFLGRTDVAGRLLASAIDPAAGDGTGLNAFHWAANRGQLEAVRLLIAHKAPLETRSMYDQTVLGTAVWSAIHEPRPNQFQIIEELFLAGARLEEAGYPTGHQEVDALLRRLGAT